MSRRLLAIAFTFLLALPAAEAGAQSTSSPAKGSGPWVSDASVGLRSSAAPAPLAMAPASDQIHAGRNIALMAVGGGAIVAGALMDDDIGTIFIVTGAVIALYGLYNYLR